MRNSSMGPPRGIDPMLHLTSEQTLYHAATSRSSNLKVTYTLQCVMHLKL